MGATGTHINHRRPAYLVAPALPFSKGRQPTDYGMRAPAPRPRNLGFGLGLRSQHYADILSGAPNVDWFEAISENYFGDGGRPLQTLMAIRDRYPVVLHGVSLSIATTAPLDTEYLGSLKRLAEKVEPQWVSDHLCWTGVHGRNLHDLLPIPYTREALDHVVERVGRVQDILRRTIALENVSSYVAFAGSEMTEWEFISELARRTGCWLIFDINNVFVSTFNHGWDAQAFIDGVPADRVIQFHLAGHEDNLTHLIDTHGAAIIDQVWDLFAKAVRRFGPVSTMIERDDNIPPLAEVVAELDHARAIAARVLGA
jgi:uncharacterized protein